MTQVWTEASVVDHPQCLLESLWEAAGPRSPAEFLALEQRALGAAGREADALLAFHLLQAHHDAAFVEQAVQAARARHGGRLRHKGLRRTSVLLPGGTYCGLYTPYLRPPTPRRPGPKRRRRGPTGVGVYPVLEALGVGDRVSPATRGQLALYTVQAGSYQEAVVLLAERGLAVDRETLVRVAQRTAQADISLREAALQQARQLPVAADGPLAGLRVRVSLDGGRVRTRQARCGRKTQKGRHRFETPWREPRVLVIDVLKDDGEADPLRLPLYDVLLRNAEATVALVIGYLRLLGAAHAAVVELVADGADWLWQHSAQIRQEAEIPPARWVEVIDFYHAAEHLHAAVELCRNVPAAQRQERYETWRHTLRHAPDGVARVLEHLQAQVRGRRGRKMSQAIGYFEKHAHRMNYAALDAQHLPVGSGPVESAVRRVINLRFKAPSTFWGAQTVADLMHLRAAFKSGRWAELIERVLTQTFAPPSFAPLTAAQIRAVLPLEPADHRPPQDAAPLDA